MANIGRKRESSKSKDSADPMMVDLAEYYFQIETDEGCAGEILGRAGLDAKELSEAACKKYADEAELIVREFGIEDLYKDAIVLS